MREDLIYNNNCTNTPQAEQKKWKDKTVEDNKYHKNIQKTSYKEAKNHIKNILY